LLPPHSRQLKMVLTDHYRVSLDIRFPCTELSFQSVQAPVSRTQRHQPSLLRFFLVELLPHLLQWVCKVFALCSKFLKSAFRGSEILYLFFLGKSIFSFRVALFGFRPSDIGSLRFFPYYFFLLSTPPEKLRFMLFS